MFQDGTHATKVEQNVPKWIGLCFLGKRRVPVRRLWIRMPLVFWDGGGYGTEIAFGLSDKTAVYSMGWKKVVALIAPRFIFC